MPLIETDFSPIGGQAGQGVNMQVFSYTSPDTLATIVADDYFNALRDRVNSGDAVVYTGTNGGTKEHGIFFFDVVPKSPSVAAVTMNAVDINAA